MKKKRVKKKSRRLEWAIAHLFLKARSRYNRLYRDIAQLGTRRHGAQALRHGAQAPCDTARKSHDKAGRARAAWLAEGCDTKFCIVAEGATLCRYTTCDTTAIRRPTPYDTV